MVQSFLPQNQLVTPSSQGPPARTTTKTCEEGPARTKGCVSLLVEVDDEGPVLPHKLNLRLTLQCGKVKGG